MEKKFFLTELERQEWSQVPETKRKSKAGCWEESEAVEASGVERFGSLGSDTQEGQKACKRLGSRT